MAIGSRPQRLLAGVLVEGIAMAALGVTTGGVGGFVLARLIGSFLLPVQLPGALSIISAAILLILAAAAASLLPAARAARVDIMQALRME